MKRLEHVNGGTPSGWIETIKNLVPTWLMQRTQAVYDYFNTNNQTQEDQRFEEIQLDLPDPSSKDNALRILNISEQDTQDLEHVRQLYEEKIRFLQERRANVTPIFAQSIDRMMTNIKEAYYTITKHQS